MTDALGRGPMTRTRTGTEEQKLTPFHKPPLKILASMLVRKSSPQRLVVAATGNPRPTFHYMPTNDELTAMVQRAAEELK